MMSTEIRKGIILLLCCHLLVPSIPLLAAKAPPTTTESAPQQSQGSQEVVQQMSGEIKVEKAEAGGVKVEKVPRGKVTPDDTKGDHSNSKDKCRQERKDNKPFSYDCLQVKDDWYVSMNIGQPAVWSLAQAHYLLAEVHSASRKLETVLPGRDALDPNRANAVRLDVLRTLLGLEAQFDESVGAKNRIEMDKFRD